MINNFLNIYEGGRYTQYLNVFKQTLFFQTFYNTVNEGSTVSSIIQYLV